MATKDEIELAIKLINEQAGSPESGPIADLIRQLKSLDTRAKEVRVIETKEKR